MSVPAGGSWRIAVAVRERVQYLVLLAGIAGVAVATLAGGLATPRPVLLALIVVAVVLPLMINMRFEALAGHLRHPRPLFCALALNFLVSPAVAVGMAAAFLPDQPEQRLALVLLALLPTSSMSLAWTALSGARVDTALFLVPANLLFAALVAVPLALPRLVGSELTIDTGRILSSIALVFVLPMVAGGAIRWGLVRRMGEAGFSRRVKPNLSTVSANALVLLVFLVMAQPRNALLYRHWDEVLWLLLPLGGYYGALYLASTAVVLVLVRTGTLAAERAVVVAYTTVTRHINISLAIALSAVPPESIAAVVLVLVIAYGLQIPSIAFYAQQFGRPLVARWAQAGAPGRPGSSGGTPP